MRVGEGRNEGLLGCRRDSRHPCQLSSFNISTTESIAILTVDAVGVRL